MQATVTTTASQLVAASNGAALVKNLGPQSMWLGFDSTVSSTNGFPLDPGESVSVARTYPASQQIWAVTSTATTVVAVLVGTV